MLATTPASKLSCADGTLLDRLSEQLATLAVRDVQVVPAGGGLGADLRGVAALARTTSAAVVVLPADLVAHTESLARLLQHPSRGTGALISYNAPGGPMCPPVRVARHKVVAAGSSFHVVPEANATFRGVLQIGEADLGCLADVADELADLAEAGKLGPVTPVEAVDLLLVGLVRSGVSVRAASLGPLHCDRVTGQSSADSAITKLADVDEDKVRLNAAVKSWDGFFATYFVSTWTRHLVRPAARLKLTPNAVTGISIGLAVLAAVWFSAGTRVAQIGGAVLLYLSFGLDCLDGQLARYTRMFTPLGAWADAMADRLKEYAVYVGLAFGYSVGLPWSTGGPDGIWFLAVAAMVLQVTRHTIDFAYKGATIDAARLGAAWSGKPPRSLLESVDFGRNRKPKKGMLTFAQKMERTNSVHYLRKMIVLPIGERMALIAITAALFNARVTFISLLLWGGVAALYTLLGRIARSLA